jgi:FAD:protein FMN transferase
VVRIWLTMILMVLGCRATTPRVPVTLEGEIFGATWMVTLVNANPVGLRHRIEQVLADVEASVSSWREDSDVNRINHAAVGEGVSVAPLTASLLTQATALHATSRGSFDITIAPLLDVWGFSSRTKGKVHQLPTATAVTAARSQLGVSHVVVSGTTVVRTAPITIDITSIGDGAAAAVVMALLRREGVTDALVDVAGEVVVIGNGVSGPWRVGINTPHRDSLPTDRIHTVSLSGEQGPRALSTSGTYREAFLLEGTPVNHIIDPRNGQPVSGSLVSCTVVGDDIVVVDALSTACLVMGEAGLEGILRDKQLQAIFVYAKDDGSYDVRTRP